MPYREGLSGLLEQERPFFRIQAMCWVYLSLASGVLAMYFTICRMCFAVDAGGVGRPIAPQVDDEGVFLRCPMGRSDQDGIHVLARAFCESSLTGGMGLSCASFVEMTA